MTPDAKHGLKKHLDHPECAAVEGGAATNIRNDNGDVVDLGIWCTDNLLCQPLSKVWW